MKTITKKITKKATEVNDALLNTTEKSVLKGIDTISRAQQFTDSKIKKGFEKSEQAQDTIFNYLENSKGFIWKKLNKTLDVFGVK
jgi:hypothetical protein